MFSQDDGDRGETAHELAKRGSEVLVEKLERIGVYVQTRQIASHPGGPEGLFVTGILGRVAFGERVQRPDQEVVDQAFEDLTDGLVEAEFEERRRALDD